MDANVVGVRSDNEERASTERLAAKGAVFFEALAGTGVYEIDGRGLAYVEQVLKRGRLGQLPPRRRSAVIVGPDGAVSCWEEWTSEASDAALARYNDYNRNRRPTVVKDLAEIMDRGEWLNTHGAIAFDRDGNIIDGQHRLAAVVKSGKKQWFLTTYMLDPAVRLVTDRHQTRTQADNLANAHMAASTYFKRPVMKAVVAMARRAIWGSSVKAGKISEPLLDTFIGRHHEALLFALDNLPLSIKRRSGVTQAPVRAAVARAYAQGLSIPKLERFCFLLLRPTERGNRMPGDKTALDLGEWLVSSKARSRHNYEGLMYRLTCRAILAVEREEELKVLRDPKMDLFPMDHDETIRAVGAMSAKESEEWVS